MFQTPIIQRESEPCPYLSGRTAQMESFLGSEVSAENLEYFLSQGWRKFGKLFFRPDCQGCKACTPLRIDVSSFRPSKSQKRVLSKNRQVEISFCKLEYHSNIYRIYRDHALTKFGQITTEKDLINNFYVTPCPAFQSEYYVKGQLAGIGFLDKSNLGLSSVYFAYAPEYSSLSLGIFSILKELEYCKELGLKYYYLGYWVAGNSVLSYKSAYHSSQKLNWQLNQWQTFKIDEEVSALTSAKIPREILTSGLTEPIKKPIFNVKNGFT